MALGSGPASDTGSLFCVSGTLQSLFTLCCYPENQQLTNLSQPESVSPCSSLQCANKQCFKMERRNQVLMQDYRSLRRVSQDFSQHSGWMDGWTNRWRVRGGEVCLALPSWRGCDGQIIEASVQLSSVMAGLRQSASANGTLRNISKLHPQTGWTRSRCCARTPNSPIAAIYRNKWECQNTVWWRERRSSFERLSRRQKSSSWISQRVDGVQNRQPLDHEVNLKSDGQKIEKPEQSFTRAKPKSFRLDWHKILG